MELEKEKITLESHKTAMELNKKFEYWANRPESVETDVTPKKVTHCMKCGKTCHDNCRYENGEKYMCIMFHKGHNYSWPRNLANAGPCDDCGCAYTDHCNNGKIYKMVDKQVLVTDEDIKKKYVQAGSEKSVFEQVVSAKEEEMRIAKT